jgi:hypothetical protein
MLKKIFIFIICFVLVLPLLSYGFDCNKPDFGAKLEDLNKDGYFVKYMEKAGISYYNYTGPCRMDAHSNYNPSISYAFIDSQLYARILNISERDNSIEDIKNKMEKNVFKQIGIAPFEIKLDGDWWIYQWLNEKDNLRYKVKINDKTKTSKSAFYYEPLRAKLPNLKEEDDPVYLRH